jgi:hypothetical protein
MASRIRQLGAALLATVSLWPMTSLGDSVSNAATVTLQNHVVGNTAFSYLQVSLVNSSGDDVQDVPPRHISGCHYWSEWHLVRVNAVSHERTYGVFIFDGCNADAQVYPVPTDIRQGSCNNDDNLFPTGKFSVCPIIEEGHVPAGLPFDARCEALTEADTSLFADVTPATYDATQPTTLTLTTSFASDMTQRLAEGTCTDVLDWNVVAWTVRWSDGAVDRIPGSGRDAITKAHELKPTAQAGTQQADVTVVAHLHVLGQALDFDQNGTTFVRRVDGYVDISNRDGATGAGAAPVDEPPVLQVGAVAAGEEADGTVPEPDPMLLPSARGVTIRGRLLALYLRPIVVQPGVELVDGAQVGVATSRVLRWRYTGAATDAPPSEGTTPGAQGDSATPVVVQYDHAERLDARGRPMDETVPVEMTVRTTYPDGTVLDSTLDGDIAVAIYYAGLTGTG